MADMGEVIKPVFRETDFLFSGPIPDHNNWLPTELNNPQFTYALLSVPRTDQDFYHIATDIPDLGLAFSLVGARIAHQEPVVRAHGESEDLYLRVRNEGFLLVYKGLRMHTRLMFSEQS